MFQINEGLMIMPRGTKPRAGYVRLDHHSQNKGKTANDESFNHVHNKINLRSSLNIDLSNVNIGHDDIIMGIQEYPTSK